MRKDIQLLAMRVARLGPLDLRAMRHFIEIHAKNALAEWVRDSDPYRDDLIDPEEFAAQLSDRAVQVLKDMINDIRWAALVDMQHRKASE